MEEKIKDHRQQNDDHLQDGKNSNPEQDQEICPNSGEPPHENLCSCCFSPCEKDKASQHDRLVLSIAKDLECDIILYAGPIVQGFERCVVDWAYNGPAYAKSTLLILATYGGSPDAAFKIARALQKRTMDKGGTFWLAVPDYCKSAGTLIAMGANALLIGENGELGPVDVQLIKKDELIGRTSGLTPQQALNTMADASMRLFEKHFLSVLHSSGTRISTRLSAKIATEIVTGLLGQVYSQIDPMQLGEAFRSMRIATDYGNMLAYSGNNLRKRALDKLVNGYPSHEFVVDLEEARNLFEYAWPMPDDIKALARLLKKKIIESLDSPVPIFEVLTEKLAKNKQTNKTGEVGNDMEKQPSTS